MVSVVIARVVAQHLQRVVASRGLDLDGDGKVSRQDIADAADLGAVILSTVIGAAALDGNLAGAADSVNEARIAVSLIEGHLKAQIREVREVTRRRLRNTASSIKTRLQSAGDETLQRISLAVSQAEARLAKAAEVEFRIQCGVLMFRPKIRARFFNYDLQFAISTAAASTRDCQELQQLRGLLDSSVGSLGATAFGSGHRPARLQPMLHLIRFVNICERLFLPCLYSMVDMVVFRPLLLHTLSVMAMLFCAVYSDESRVAFVCVCCTVVFGSGCSQVSCSPLLLQSCLAFLVMDEVVSFSAFWILHASIQAAAVHHVNWAPEHGADPTVALFVLCCAVLGCHSAALMGDCGKMFLMIGETRFAGPDDVGLIKRRHWHHVAVVVARRQLLLYVDGQKVMQESTAGSHQFVGLHGPQHGVIYIGLPPSDMAPYNARNWLFPGYVFQLAYHDEGISQNEVDILHSGGRQSLPLKINKFEQAEDNATSCVFPYMLFRPSPLSWLVTSDVWEKLEAPIMGLMASKSHLRPDGRDEFQMEAVQTLRSAASSLLAACFDLDEISSVRMRQWAINFARVRSVPPVIKLHLNDESFSFEFKIRFRQYSNVEEGAKFQTILSSVVDKRNSGNAAEARDMFRINLESLPTAVADPEKDGFYSGEESETCWYISFTYYMNTTRLKIPPQTGPDGWLHCTIGYVDGKTELAASWDGDPPRTTDATYTKDMFRTEAYFGCEVRNEVTGTTRGLRPVSQLLCDIAYLRVWDNYEPAHKLNEEFADAGAPHPLMVAGNQAVFVTLMPIIHEDKGFILDVVPTATETGAPATHATKSGPFTNIFPGVRSRYNVATQWQGCLFTS
ncbi:unnamed protein product, partial [Polarella glacialis]